MAMFRFVFEEGSGSTTVEAEMANEAEAREEAFSTTRKSMAEAVQQGRDPREWRTMVYDARQKCIVEVGFGDIAK